MRAARLPLVFFVCLGSFACGVTSPRAVAEPRKLDEPLFREALDTDAAAARAIREH